MRFALSNKRINHDAAARRGLCAGRWADHPSGMAQEAA
jgi:hypothetical protein